MEAYITLLTSNSYASGALVLAHSLRATNTSKHLAVLVTTSVSRPIRDRLAAVFDALIEIGEINSHATKNLQLLGRPELGVTLTKIHVFNQTQYSKVVFLDADTLVLKNLDHLFDTAANGSIEDQDRNKRFAAAPDAGWPDCFNSGVFVCRPSYKDYTGLIEMAGQQGTFDGGDQGLLNSYFSGWSTGDSSNRLPFLYNTTPTSVYSYAPAFQQYGDKLAIVHFIGSFKPWQWLRFADGTVFPRNTSSTDSITLVQKWWGVFDHYVGGKPSDIHEVSHGYDLPPQSQWDNVGLDGQSKKPESEKKLHYDGWFQPYEQQQPKLAPAGNHFQNHQEHNGSLQHETAEKKNQQQHEKEQERQGSTHEARYSHNPHHLTDYHYQPELESETAPHHRYHHNRHDSGFGVPAGYQNAWDLDEDPRMLHPPLYYEKAIDIEESNFPEATSSFPSGKGRPVFPWEHDHSSTARIRSRNSFTDSSTGTRTPSRVYYNYTASAQERQEYFEWEAARQLAYEKFMREQHRMQFDAQYERDRIIAEAQARVQDHKAMENIRLVNAWDVDLGVQISILQRSERSKPSRPGTRNPSRRNSVVLARGKQLQEQYEAELVQQQREEEVRWHREQGEARLKEEEERIEKLKQQTLSRSRRVTATVAESGYVFRNAWDPPEVTLHKKKISIQDEEVALALPLRQHRQRLSIGAQDTSGSDVTAIALDGSSAVDMNGSESTQERRINVRSSVAVKDHQVRATSSSSSQRMTLSGSHRISTTVTSTTTHRRFKNGVEVESTTNSGSTTGEIMSETPAGMHSLPFFAHGHQSMSQSTVQEPSRLVIGFHTHTGPAPASNPEGGYQSALSSSEDTQPDNGKDPKNKGGAGPLSVDIRAATSTWDIIETPTGTDYEFSEERYTHAALPLGSPYMPSTPLVSMATHRYGVGMASGSLSRPGSQPTTPGSSNSSQRLPSPHRDTTHFRDVGETSPQSRATAASYGYQQQQQRQSHRGSHAEDGFSNYKVEWNWKELTGKKPRDWSSEEGQERYDPYSALSNHGSSAGSDDDELQDNTDLPMDDEDSDEEEVTLQDRGVVHVRKEVSLSSLSIGEASEFAQESGFVIRGGKIARRRSSAAMDLRELNIAPKASKK
ncbi:hypothetical protein BGZ54_007698 [Gamsiella multidivaricata]|nr:hypothetical protein BGZ54_007698 [Gamsiella multidivaricata]